MRVPVRIFLAVSMTAGLATYPGARGSGAASSHVVATAPTVALSVAPADFSPNHDGRRDTTTISVTPDRPVDLTLSVKRPSGASVRRLALDRPIDAATSMTWWGLNDARRHAPDGRYLVVARVVDPTSGQTATGNGHVAIDTVRPSLTGLRVSPEPWTGTGGVHLAFTLADAGPGGSFTVGFAVRDVTGRRVRRVTHLVRERGIRSVTWDARKPSGGFAPNGGYAFVLRATDEAGNRRESRATPFRLARPVSASVVSWVEGAGRRVALTFDDCGNRDAWSRILTTLHESKVRATFFCVGRYVKVWPGLSRRTASLGMTIGNHTWNHVDLRTASRDTSVRQIQADGAVWWTKARATPLPYLRPPGGSYDEQALAIAGHLGYRWMVLWNVDPRDWSGIPASAITRAVLANTNPGGIVVLHVRSATADALPSILRGLTVRHLSPVSLTTLLRSGTPRRGWWPASYTSCRADDRLVESSPETTDC
jgi:peptidoglycan/xylan/chitin deacetylase (PgdA/CDA1 family)/flagellar hook assembly protein FlgD